MPGASACYLTVALILLPVAILSLHWLYCRLTAQRCPACQSKWQTELEGEWGGELWHCHACFHNWETPYRE